MTYIPEPLNTQEVVLSDELLELTEQMARNVHQVWAESRISQGWHYGSQRNDVEKTHPCLVPYDELPEVEKEYDRNTATGTLKLIISLGFEINKKQ